MQIIDKLKNLQYLYKHDTDVQKNGTKLVGLNPQTPPLAKHYIFAPMDPSVRKHLIESYKLDLPEELLELYQFANGFDLFWKCVLIGKRGFRIPRAQLCIYGVPGTMRDPQQIEPFNISVEDLNRPEMTPDTWLKFGSYQIIPDFGNPSDEYAIFVDTYSHEVHAVKRANNKCESEQVWPSIDACLCDLFDLINQF